jgi:hypothetical protein
VPNPADGRRVLGADVVLKTSFGVREPLLSWLRDADVAKLFLLASSPELVYEVRVPPDVEARILTACTDGPEGQWLAAMHLALANTEGIDGRPD